MLSTGIDIVEIKRIQKAMKNPRFLERILGRAEYLELHARKFPAQSVAANFCAKEAFSKSLGTGIRGFELSEVEVLRDAGGKPYFKLSGGALQLAVEKGLSFSVSLTHSRDYAAAVVVAQEEFTHENIQL